MEDDQDSLVKRADEALYRAKVAGEIEFFCGNNGCS
jgi:PleD family two-component response regulator